MRFLTDADVAAILTPRKAADAVERAFVALAAGNAAVQTRLRTTTPAGKLSTVGAVLTADGLAGAKIYTTTNRGRFGFVVLLFELENGRPLAVMEGAELTRIRTAATSVVAARHLARSDSKVLTIFGAGHQALAHALAFHDAFTIEEIRLVHRKEGQDFLERIGAATGLAARQVTNPREANKDADLVVTATRATEPLFPGVALPEGVHLTAVGATLPNTSELDVETVGRADLVVVESISQARQEAGDLLLAEAAGAFELDRAVELADLVTGKVPGRTSPDQITIFESIGIGLEDVAVAAEVYALALAAQIGTELPSGGE